MRSVHRMLVEDHDILHRDISWTNVLIGAIHLEGADNHDDFCGRPFIDAILGVEYASQMSKDNGTPDSNLVQGKSKGGACYIIGLIVRAFLEVISYVEVKLRCVMHRLPGVGLCIKRERPCLSRERCACYQSMSPAL